MASSRNLDGAGSADRSVQDDIARDEIQDPLLLEGDRPPETQTPLAAPYPGHSSRQNPEWRSNRSAKLITSDNPVREDKAAGQVQGRAVLESDAPVVPDHQRAEIHVDIAEIYVGSVELHGADHSQGRIPASRDRSALRQDVRKKG